MATIALYADKINHMPDLVKDAGNSVACLKSEMFGIKSRSLSVNQSICDMDDVISSISASTQTQEDKMNALNRLGEDVRQFAAEADRIDGEAADIINERKQDFYDKYSYLKPDSEKGLLEKIWSGCMTGLQSAGEWCKQHWKFVVTVVLVVAAIVVLSIGAPVVGGIIFGAAKGLLAGAAAGGIWAVIDRKEGESLFDAFERGIFEGALSGAAGGAAAGLVKSLGIGKTLISKAKPFIQQIISGGAESAANSLVGDIIKGEASFPKVVINTVGAAVTGGVLSAASFGISKISKIEGINKGRGSWKHVWEAQFTRSLRHGTSIHLKTILKGLGVDFFEKNINKGQEKLNDVIESGMEKWMGEWKKSLNLSPQY